MFRSIKRIKTISGGRYKIIDSDFVSILNTLDGLPIAMTGIIVAKEYIKRNLPVAKNIALFCLYIESFGHNMENITGWQDKSCSGIQNWTEIAVERDRYLDKLSPMK